MLNNLFKNIITKHHFKGMGLEKAEGIFKSFPDNNWVTTLSIWTHPEEDKNSVAKKYVEIINAVSQKGLETNLSINRSTLQFDLSLLEYITKEVRNNNVKIQFDSLVTDLAEKSLRYFNHAKTIYDNVGYTIPAQWLRRFKEAEEITGLSVPVRILKGQWCDPANIKIDVHENFFEVIKILIDKVPLIAIATHDLRLIEKAIELYNKTEAGFDFENFVAISIIAKAIKSHSDKQSVKTHLYLAYGEPYSPFNLNSLTESREVMEWLARDLLKQKRSFYVKK